MFHLLVKYNGWAPAQDSLPRGRVFEYTDKVIVEQFQPGGTLDLGRIVTLPALFISETEGTGDQRARVGTINRVRVSAKDVIIEYTWDEGVPPVSNSALLGLANELEINSFEFSRTHWAIKETDLFRGLLRNWAAKVPSPKVFKIDSAEDIDESLLSVMMPFAPEFNDVFATIDAVATTLNMRCLRADNIWENDAIVQDVVSLINRSRIVICDCTGRNANVFYETGIAHTLGRHVILIAQSKADIPFDISHLRYVTYLNDAEGRQQFANRLQQRVQAILQQPL